MSLTSKLFDSFPPCIKSDSGLNRAIAYIFDWLKHFHLGIYSLINRFYKVMKHYLHASPLLAAAVFALALQQKLSAS